MPGIASDGGEDLPSNDQPMKFGMCPFCYSHATHMAKNPEGTRYCKNGHQWPHRMSLLAVPHNQCQVKAPSEHCVYGACPTCGEPGVTRARDIEGTTNCKNNHAWKAHQIKQKPIATEQNPVYTEHQQQAQLIKQITDTVHESAHEARENAAYGGSHSDGGASQMMSKLEYWLDGIKFATTGKSTIYKHLVDQFERERDPDYQLWLKLNDKFGK